MRCQFEPGTQRFRWPNEMKERLTVGLALGDHFRASNIDSDDSESTTDRMTDMNGEETVTTQNNLLVSKKIHVEQIFASASFV